MARHLKRHAILSETTTFDDKGNLRVVIETPKGSRTKYAYDPACDCFNVKTVMPQGMSFPFDFGFIPSTEGGDGDPLDVLILMDFSLIAGAVLTARPIGIIAAKEKKKGEDWERNDRIIAVATHARTHDGVRSLKDLNSHLVEEITAFFVEYNKLHGKKFKPLHDAGPHAAQKAIEQGRKRFRKKSRSH